MNKIYKILNKGVSEDCITYNIRLDSTHQIYKAHFPNEPITPGVCIVQIAKELLEEHTGTKLEISKLNNVKFLSIISPEVTSDVIVELTKISCGAAGMVKAMALVKDETQTFSKISFTCQPS